MEGVLQEAHFSTVSGVQDTRDGANVSEGEEGAGGRARQEQLGTDLLPIPRAALGPAQ